MIRSAFRWLVDYMHDSWHFITALFERMDKIHMGLIAAGVAFYAMFAVFPGMAALIALLLPPSHNMIIYSISGGGRISIADLFTAGIIPGLLLALAELWVARRGRVRAARADGPGAVGRSHTAADVTSR